jgi:hypothetical protein
LQGRNEVVDELANLGFGWAMVPPGSFMQELHEPSITKALAKASRTVESSQGTMSPVESISESPKDMKIYSDWHTSFMIRLKTGDLLEDKDERELLRCQARVYTLVNNELFWQSTNGTLIQCILLDEGCAIL